MPLDVRGRPGTHRRVRLNQQKLRHTPGSEPGAHSRRGCPPR
jgi:hypothetical protein